MSLLITITLLQLSLLLFLVVKNKNDGERYTFQQQKWKALDVLIIIILINVYFYSYYCLARFEFLYVFLSSSKFSFYHLFLLLTVLILFKFRFKQSFKYLGLNTVKLPRLVGISLGTAFASTLLIILINLLLSRGSAVIGSDLFGTVKDLSNYQDYILFAFNGFIVGPISEECVFRGIFYSPYRKKYGPVKAILMTAFLFAFSHYSESGYLSFIVNGILFGMLYEKTESILSVIIAHSTYNLFIAIAAIYLLSCNI